MGWIGGGVLGFAVEPPAGGARVRTEAEIQLNNKVTETRLQSLTNALPPSRTQRRRFLIGCLTWPSLTSTPIWRYAPCFCLHEGTELWEPDGSLLHVLLAHFSVFILKFNFSFFRAETQMRVLLFCSSSSSGLWFVFDKLPNERSFSYFLSVTPEKQTIKKAKSKSSWTKSLV